MPRCPGEAPLKIPCEGTLKVSVSDEIDYNLIELLRPSSN
jgi:hypothetical protein